jgi:hypothetical protein
VSPSPLNAGLPKLFGSFSDSVEASVSMCSLDSFSSGKHYPRLRTRGCRTSWQVLPALCGGWDVVLPGPVLKVGPLGLSTVLNHSDSTL